MGSSAPSPPPAPDPVATAQAQTGENVATAIANANLSHVNQTDPYGDKITYSQNGTTPFSEGGQTYQIPNYTENTTLSPQGQTLYNTTLGTEQNIANDARALRGQAQIGNKQSAYIADSGYVRPGNINDFINTQWEQPFNRLEGQQQEQLDQKLASEGINLNDPAYNNAQYNFGQQVQGQQDTYDTAMYGEAAQNILAQTGFNNQVALTQQNQPINELSALLGESQVSQPNFTQVPQQQIPTTDVAGITQNSYQDQLATYDQQMQNYAANQGGLFGLGGSILGGLVKAAPSMMAA